MLIHTTRTDQSTEERTIQYKFSSCSRLHHFPRPRSSFTSSYEEDLGPSTWSLIQQVLEDGGPEERVVGYYELTALFLAAAFAQELELSHGWPEGKTIAPVRVRASRVGSCVLAPGDNNEYLSSYTTYIHNTGVIQVLQSVTET